VGSDGRRGGAWVSKGEGEGAEEKGEGEGGDMLHINVNHIVSSAPSPTAPAPAAGRQTSLQRKPDGLVFAMSGQKVVAAVKTNKPKGNYVAPAPSSRPRSGTEAPTTFQQDINAAIQAANTLISSGIGGGAHGSGGETGAAAAVATTAASDAAVAAAIEESEAARLKTLKPTPGVGRRPLFEGESDESDSDDITSASTRALRKRYEAKRQQQQQQQQAGGARARGQDDGDDGHDGRDSASDMEGEGSLRHRVFSMGLLDMEDVDDPAAHTRLHRLKDLLASFGIEDEIDQKLEIITKGIHEERVGGGAGAGGEVAAEPEQILLEDFYSIVGPRQESKYSKLFEVRCEKF
jgi:hypothetical protein